MLFDVTRSKRACHGCEETSSTFAKRTRAMNTKRIRVRPCVVRIVLSLLEEHREDRSAARCYDSLQVSRYPIGIERECNLDER